MRKPLDTERNVPPLAERCTYWLRGQQCPSWRVDGSTRCALHDAGRRYANEVKA